MNRRFRFVAITITSLLCAAVCANGAILVGQNTLLGTVDHNPPGTAEAFRTTAAATGTLSRLTIYVDATSTATQIVAGLYADSLGRPGALLGQGTRSSPAAGAWNDVAIPPSNVTAGTTYWIAILGPVGSGTMRFRDSCCGGGSPAETSAQTNLATLPGTWSRGAVWLDGPMSAYGSSVDGAVLQVTPASLGFTGAVGGADPAARQVDVANAGTGGLGWSATSSVPWLAITPASAPAPSTANVAVSLAGLAAGTYSGQISVSSPGAAGSPATVGVTVDVAAAPDTTPPSVALTAPVGGATVTGTVAVGATASDNTAVSGVRFTLDGSPLGIEDTSAPYSISWNTTQVANGGHTLRAVARDAAGNESTSSPVALTVGNTAPPPSAGLVAAWGFDEGSGASVADATGAGHTGTVSGATWTTTGKYGKALSFDGINDWVTVADTDDLDLTGAMTLEAWVNPSALGTTWRTVAIKEAPGYFRYALYGNTDSTGPSAHVFIGSDLEARRPARLATGVWSHVAAVYDGARVRVYVNGVEGASSPATGTMAASADPLRIGGNAVWSEWFAGQIDEVRIYNRALGASEIQSDMNLPIAGGGPPPGDTTAPTVTITAPVAGATVSAATTVAASASDNVGVAGVQFRLDGANLGGEDTTAPFAVSWNTGQASDGAHALTAVARDAAGNTSVSPGVSVTVQNGAPASQVGRWSAVQQWPIVPVHTVLMPTGQVLAFDAWDQAINTQRIWDPTLEAFVSVPYARNLFCGGHTSLGDGRTIVVGGNVSPYVGLADTTIFDHTSNTWSRRADMARTRWYPTATTLPDGRVLSISGDKITRGSVLGRLFDTSATLPEIYDPVGNTWSSLSGAQRDVRLYPFMFVLPDGRVIDAGPATQSQILNVSTGAWSTGPVSQIDGHSAVMYRPGRILKSGTAADPDFPNLTVTNRAVALDMTAATPGWRDVAPMAFPRSYHTLTALPDGTVLTTGGGRTSDGYRLDQAVLAAEIWDPATETWTAMASQQIGRLYHSTSLLLPDGRVLVAGGGRLPNGAPVTDQPNAEIYSPPYLFKGPRPTITSAPPTARFGDAFALDTPNAAQITSVGLVRLGSVTHGLDMNQRYVPLSFTAGTGSLQVQAPANANVAPPGVYMLFVVDTTGVPSVAEFIRFPVPAAGDTAPPSTSVSAPASGATVSGTVQVTATAGDDSGVAGVRFTRDGAPLGSEDTTAPYAVAWDTTLVTNGSHTLRSIARDAAGNETVSAPVTITVQNASADETPPSVSITTPAAGGTVSGAVNVIVNASDNVGVAGVQVRLAGAPLGSEDTVAPFSVAWDTVAATNGAHSITAVARDAAGNTTTSAAVNVTVQNTAPGGSGPVAAWGFEEASGTSVTDATGKGHTGAISGAARTATGRHGRGLSFDGVNDWVTIADANDLDLARAMTLEAWVNPTQLGTAWRTAIIKESPGYFTYALYANTNSTGPSAHVFVGADLEVRRPTRLAIGAWAHIAAVYDGARVRIYVNGVESASAPATGPMLAGTGVLRLGGNAVWNEWFAGQIDEVRIYDRALSTTEIQTDMSTQISGV